MATRAIGLGQEQLMIASVYTNSADPEIQLYLDLLQRLFRKFDKGTSKILVLTDLNCRSTSCGRNQTFRQNESRLFARFNCCQQHHHAQQARAGPDLHQGNHQGRQNRTLDQLHWLDDFKPNSRERRRQIVSSKLRQNHQIIFELKTGNKKQRTFRTPR